MSLSDSDRAALSGAGTTPDPVLRRRAVAIALGKSDTDLTDARELLAAGFTAATQPSFQYIPRGDSMAGEEEFDTAYAELAACTKNFVDVSSESLAAALTSNPATLAPLRMILGLTHNELAWSMKQVRPESRTAGGTLKNFERNPSQPPEARTEMIETIAAAVLAVVDRSILQVPETARKHFHSKLDKRDTRGGWSTVAEDAGGVPYSALLYQRYVGGVWRQVQDAYSEVKGDRLLEQPIADLFEANHIAYLRAGGGASGAKATAELLGLSPGPDFALPLDSPTVVIESKVAEDGGTARDKASRIINLARAAEERGLLACAVIDGRGWSERANALADVVIATQGRTYSLATLHHLLDIPDIDALRGTAR
ncbi:MAG: hypothetical protein F4062_00450 [Acidimicrobiia bacterium]|nr:hypothetical protein [Acidimicrobiia bacterium]